MCGAAFIDSRQTDPGDVPSGDAFIASDGALRRWKAARRWQRAMARAAVKRHQEGDEGTDLRVSIPLAPVELSSARPVYDDETLARLGAVRSPVEVEALGLRGVR